MPDLLTPVHKVTDFLCRGRRHGSHLVHVLSTVCSAGVGRIFRGISKARFAARRADRPDPKGVQDAARDRR